ncbi:MAG: exonuclease SbcCD subunit D C-terminal domain-containing protein, partial [Myxococcales bacterium]|nr:exonuclease SbcCD subunit D C-terminal domain-containing protein [Myxococcales bacterium]
PSHQALSLYFAFLGRLVRTCCRHVVVVAGNHDSASLIDAPKPLLDALDIHIVGAVPRRPLEASEVEAEDGSRGGSIDDAIAFEDEILVLRNGHGQPELIVCAVPYLKERDVRRVGEGEGPDERVAQAQAGIRAHYARVCELAEARRQALSPELPIVATGHLFATGGVADDGERDLLVGSLLQIDAEATFPQCIDYLALGHLHAPQVISGHPAWRYSGSPLPMTFSDARCAKGVCVVEFQGRRLASVRQVEVPCFQARHRIAGTWAEIEDAIARLKEAGSAAWLEIVHQRSAAPSEPPIPELSERIEALLEGSPMIALVSRELGATIEDASLIALHPSERLQDLDESEVFERLLSRRCATWPEEAVAAVRETFREALQGLRERDAKAG